MGAALDARYKRNDTNVHYAIQDDKNIFEMITSLTGSKFNGHNLILVSTCNGMVTTSACTILS